MHKNVETQTSLILNAGRCSRGAAFEDICEGCVERLADELDPRDVLGEDHWGEDFGLRLRRRRAGMVVRAGSGRGDGRASGVSTSKERPGEVGTVSALRSETWAGNAEKRGVSSAMPPARAIIVNGGSGGWSVGGSTLRTGLPERCTSRRKGAGGQCLCGGMGQCHLPNCDRDDA